MRRAGERSVPFRAAPTAGAPRRQLAAEHGRRPAPSQQVHGARRPVSLAEQTEEDASR
jgi:hypothetical protein